MSIESAENTENAQQIEKLKMHSKDFIKENIAKIAELFPNCVTETRDENGKIKQVIDFDLLRQEFSDSIVEGPQERYHLNWPGKRHALITANTPISKTLRPCPNESVDFDTTKNLFIEGDNLEALKLLQENYLGKVKMIYIDPPYNTGKDFIYKDNFTESREEFLKRSDQLDEEGNRLVVNTESNGRFHSDWLSMIYPRLKLARNLLRDDGVIFISIDENEVHNLRKVCDEVFGEKNHISDLVWQNKKGGGNDAKYCAVEHEYVVVYAKNIQFLPRLFEAFSEEYAKRYREKDEIGRYFWDTFKRKSGKQYYSIICPDGTVLKEDEFGNPLSWLRSESRFKSDLRKGDVKFEKRTNGWSVMFKQRMPEGKKPRSLVLEKGTTSDGSTETLLLFKRSIFSNPKPVSLLIYLLGIGTGSSDLILDFFAGSCTTAHAVMQLNAEDGGNRKFIMVQLPEKCDEKSEAYKAGYTTIADIGKERIRRAGKKIKEENATTAPNLDVGFRVLKVDSSNMKDVFFTPDETKQMDLKLNVDNIKEDRTPEDLLFQVLLQSGVELSLPIVEEDILGKRVFFVDDNALAACFDKDITEEVVKKIAQRKPLKAAFRDIGFSTDSAKINVEQIFNLISPRTELKTI